LLDPIAELAAQRKQGRKINFFINISGATMSVRSMSAGAKRALVLVDELILQSNGRDASVHTASRNEKGHEREYCQGNAG